MRYADRARAFGWHAIEIDGHDVDGDRRGLHRGRGRRAQADGASSPRPRRARASRRSRTWRGSTASRSPTPRRGSPSSAASATCGSRSPRRGTGRRTSSPPTPAPRCRAGSSASPSRRGWPTARRSPRSASGGATWWRSTGRSRTRRTRSSSARRSPRASSRCSSPSSSWSPRRSGCRCAAGRRSRSTFAAFFTRAYDFVRMAAISAANLRLSGSHAGVSIGEDGPSQMALEDLASSARSTAAPCCTPPTPTRPSRWSRRWPTATASPTSAPCAGRPRYARPRTRRCASAAAGSCATATT